VGRLAEAIIKAQAAIIYGNADEAAHALYAGANPAFDRLTPFAELEKLAGTTVVLEIDKLKAALQKGVSGEEPKPPCT